MNTKNSLTQFPFLSASPKLPQFPASPSSQSSSRISTNNTSPTLPHFSQFEKSFTQMQNVLTEASVSTGFRQTLSLIDNCIPAFSVRSNDKTVQDNIDEALHTVCQTLRPWRKGPFRFNSMTIQSEWDSTLKWQRLKTIASPLDICNGKRVLDVGTNNLFYALLMVLHGAHRVCAVDFMPKYRLFYKLFCLLYPRMAEVLKYEECRIEQHFGLYDTLFCMGVLYHHRNPLALLTHLHSLLDKDGIMILETICLPNESPYCLFPPGRYQKAKGFWFIPSLAVLRAWLTKTNFSGISMTPVIKTDDKEQRASEWGSEFSLTQMLDPHDFTLTYEGHPAPWRVVVRAVKK